ncbi:MAG: lipoprotein-releasing system ATP-binding protein LolD 2 [Pirellulaceae bacterium]|nr:MAG: lipoprotein-releasing system ATP-binding protein LolD 2 [Pirellulaceae bacterium]
MNSTVSVTAPHVALVPRPTQHTAQTAHVPPAAAPHTTALLRAEGLVKNYQRGRHLIRVLQGVDLEVADGEFLAIVGQSGSGKSTLLHLLGTLDAPDQGCIYFQGHRIDQLPPAGRDILRNKYFGMVFQFYHLLPELTTRENILVPLMIRDGLLRYWWGRRQYVKRADQLLALVGLEHRAAHRPRELSGGEMQRAAIARALVAEPSLLLADEPTGNLDRHTGQAILDLLRTLNRQQRLTIVMVTHDPSIAAQADRVVRLNEGRIEAA